MPKPRGQSDPFRNQVPDVSAVLEQLKQLATEATLKGMARYALPSDRAFGVAMRDIQSLAKSLGRSHELALDLWESGWYEAVAGLVRRRARPGYAGADGPLV